MRHTTPEQESSPGLRSDCARDTAPKQWLGLPVGRRLFIACGSPELTWVGRTATEVSQRHSSNWLPVRSHHVGPLPCRRHHRDCLTHSFTESPLNRRVPCTNSDLVGPDDAHVDPVRHVHFRQRVLEFEPMLADEKGTGVTDADLSTTPNVAAGHRAVCPWPQR